MSDFSFKRDFKNIRWKSTLGLNFLRSAIAGVVWFFIATFIHKMPEGGSWEMLFFPFFYLVILLPFGLFGSFLSSLGVPFAGLLTFFFALCVTVADPIMYILHRTIPKIVPVEKYKFLSLHLVIFVLNNPDLAANDESDAPKEINRAEVKKLLSSKMRYDEDEDVNFLKEEIIADEVTRDDKIVGGLPKLEISNSVFNFYDLRAGSTITDIFTIINAGGDKLSGSIKTNRKWLKVFQSEIDPTQRKQDVIFRINTSGLAFGFHDTGTIEIRSNAGIERVSVTISVEAATIASLRREINIPAIAGLGALGLAIAVTVLAWQMALKTEKEAKSAKSTIKLAKPIIKQEQVQQKESQMQESTQKSEGQNILQERKEFHSSAQTAIYFVTGHGERQFEDFDRSGISGVANSLKQNNCRLATLNILTAEKIPDDCDVLVIAGPTKAYLTEELNIIRNYLGNKGKLLLMLEPAVTPNTPTGLKTLLAEYGIVVRDDVVVYSKVNMPLFGIQTVAEIYIGKDEYADYPITEDLKSYITIIMGACSVGSAPPNDQMPYQATVLINAPEGSWGETDVKNLRQKRPELNVGVDLQDAITLAVASQAKESPNTVTRSHPDMANDPEATPQGARLVVFGDVDFASNEYIKEPGNAGLFLNSVNWLVNKGKQHKQREVQSLVTYDLTGEWDGKVDNKKATLKIFQDGNSISGDIVYDNVTEFLSGEINNDQIVLKGTGYTAKGVTGFSLDTFQGMVSKDVNSINGNYADEDGHNGSWFIKRVLVTSSPDLEKSNTISNSTPNQLVVQSSQQINPQNAESINVDMQLSGAWEGVVADKTIRLSITQDGNFLSGRMENGNRKENLSGEINKDWVVLGGSSGSFNGTVAGDRNSMGGQYSNLSGDNVRWFVKRVLVASYPDINNANTVFKGSDSENSENTDVRTQSKIGAENTGRELSNNNRRDGTNRISSFFSTLQDSNRNHSTKRDSSVKVERYTTTRRYQLFDKEKKVSKPRTETRVRKQTEKKPKKSKKSKKKSK